MAFEFNSKKTKKTKTKRLSILPRVGIYVDVLGHEFTFKNVPVLETAYNLVTSGLTVSNLKKITKRQFSEIDFKGKDEIKTVNTTAKEIKSKKLS